jgi:TatD DNase family protein
MWDTHVHLHYDAYAADREAVLVRAAGAGVTTCLLPGSTLADSQAAVALAEREAASPCVLYAAVGIHPTSADELTPAALVELRALARHPGVVAIGEIGLDYYWPALPDRGWPCADPPQQRAALVAQLELAAELGLPVLIHDREAHADTLQLLRTWVAGGPGRTGTLHAYAGGPALLDEALALGFYIGMDGPVTFRKATALHEVARRVPLDRLLLETDGPYLTPEPYRGRRNEPAYLLYIARRIAELKAVSVEQVMKATAENARRLFKVGPAVSGEK